MKIAVAQINTTIADFDGNCSLILDRVGWAKSKQAGLIVFPELSVCGYPPRDLLEKPDFAKRNTQALERIAKNSNGIAIVVGAVTPNKDPEGRSLFNSAVICNDGKIDFIQHKTLLPEYDVFDEARHFEPAHKYSVYRMGECKIGLSMCEDIWSPYKFKGRRLYHSDPLEMLIKAGANIILNLSASPFTLTKHEIRKNLVRDAAVRFGLPIIYCNLVGGNDELVFDGKSFVVDKKGNLVYQAKNFEPDSFIIDTGAMKPVSSVELFSEEEEVEKALILGLRDYMRKCGFSRVVIGLSGGIDSAVVAAIAVKALGSANVLCVMMPSGFSSPGSILDSQALAKNLNFITCKVSIAEILDSYRSTLGFTNEANVSVAEENIQARIRGNILMAISNREGAMVLSTGNKSELSVGYCTLYGDMAGGFALISDLPKTFVYRLARHINRDGEVIPRAIIDKPPSAELRPNQTDQDTLPDYEVLDGIIRAYVEERQDIDTIIVSGFDKDIVKKVVHMIDSNEYKRRQAAPGIKITSKAFGSGRRFPIAWKQ